MSLTSVNANISNDNDYQRQVISTNSSGLPKRQNKKKSVRNASSNRSLTKLSLNGSQTEKANLRPDLGRSKSTDVLMKTGHRVGSLKRNNRSLTRLSTIAGLQPLTKTTSNSSIKHVRSSGTLKMHSTSSLQVGGLKTSGKKERAILRLNDDDYDSNEYEDVEGSIQNESEETLEKHTQQANTENQIESNSISGIESLDLKRGDFSSQIVSSKKIDEQKAEAELHGPALENFTSESMSTSSVHNNLYGGSLLLSQSTGLVKKLDTSIHANKQPFPKGESFSNQRGLVTIDSDSSLSIERASNIPSISDTNSGLSFKASPPRTTLAASNNIAHPVLTSNNNVKGNSYQPDQSIFSNLQRTNTQYLSAKQKARDMGNKLNKEQASGKDNMLESYLDQSNSSHNNIETRTQQRLWLQRENSLMDVVNATPQTNFSNLSLNNLMFNNNYSTQNMRNLASSHMPQKRNPESSSSDNNYLNNLRTEGKGFPTTSNEANSSGLSINRFLKVTTSLQNPIQSRTEYERLNREYLNVRRNLNPIGESLTRIEKILADSEGLNIKKSEGIKNGNQALKKSQNAINSNTFSESVGDNSEKEAEKNALLVKIWQEAVMSTMSSSLSPQRSVAQSPQSAYPAPLKVQRIKTTGDSIPDSYTAQSPSHNLRFPNTPTTRAVKLAQKAQEKAQNQLTGHTE